MGRRPAPGGGAVVTALARRDSFPVVADVTETPAAATELHPGHVLGRHLRLAQARAAWLGERLAEQIEREGVAGAVGDTTGITADGAQVRLGEYARVLGELEARERATVTKLAAEVARLGIDSASAAGAAGAAGAGQMVPVTTAVQWISEIVSALGHDWGDDSVRRVAQRVLIDARRRAQSAMPLTIMMRPVFPQLSLWRMILNAP